VGTIAFVALGALLCVVCAVALLVQGATPWLLTSFWGGAATLLAGLLDLIGRDGAEQIVGVTVAAVVSLLLLSALGLGQYVRLIWPLSGRAMLESLPMGVTGQSGSGGSMTAVEQAPRGRWMGHWVVRTRDAARPGLPRRRGQSRPGGDENRTCSRLRAMKEGYARGGRQ
jgi:hypothetical protein